jgi:hypothetical protein
MNRLQGLPGVLLLRSLLVVILVSILVGLFLDRSDRLSRQVWQAARQQDIARLNTALALQMLQAASRGRLSSLAGWDRANPFERLAATGKYAPPADYRGEWKGGNALPGRPGWYFDVRHRSIAWFDGDRWLERWQLRLRYQDIDGDGRFDPETDRLQGLGMKKAAD